MAIIKKNITYDAENKLQADLYYPNNTSSETKILIFWHGGGWFRGHKENFKKMGTKCANAGFMTFIPEYRLAPAHVFPAAHHDALHFTEWLLNSKYTDENDLQNIVQIGSSSGGTMALYLAGKYGFPTVTWSAPVEYSTWMKEHEDVKPSPAAQDEFGLTDRRAINDSFYKYFALTYTGTAEEKVLQKLDVRSYDLRNLDKLMMINSADELTPLNTVLSFVSFLAKHNHEVQLLVIKGHGHAMDYGPDYLDESLDFLFQVIKRQNQE